ncbi:MAG TPA: type VI secretion system tube protein Hcp [Lacipirellula sp.]
MKRLLMTAAISLLSVRAAQAELYLKLTGVPGSSFDAGRRDWLDIEEFGIGVFTPPDPTPNDPRDNPIPSVTAMRVIGVSSSSSPYLFFGAASGEIYSTMDLHIVETDAKGAPRVRAFWQMTPARITRYETDTQDNGSTTLVSEKYEVTPGEILKYGYNSYAPDGTYTGTTEVEWNLATGQVRLIPKGTVSGFQFLTGNVDVGDLPPATPVGPGGGTPPAADFDQDGDVDGADLVEWTGDFGVNELSDADDDGDSDGADLLAWQRQLGSVSAEAAASSVPEPGAFVLAATSLAVAATLLRRRNTVLAAAVGRLESL